MSSNNNVIQLGDLSIDISNNKVIDPFNTMYIGDMAIDTTTNKIIEDPNDPNNYNNNSEIHTDYTSVSTSERMKDFKNVINKLSNKFNNNRPVYTQYLYFKVNNNILVDTASLSWSKNNLVSFNLKKNGSGQANTFTLNILFPPNDRSIQDIMTIEKILLDTCAITKSETEEELKDAASLFMDCEFKYGYGDDTSLRSPKYTGKVMDYSCSVENGNMVYTITGYAGIYGLKETKISPKKEYIEGATNEDGSIHPIQFIENIFKEEFQNPNSKYYNRYNLIVLDDVKDTEYTYIGDDFTQFPEKNIFTLINDVLSGCVSSKESEVYTSNKKFSVTQKQVYGYYVDSSTNSNTDGTVYIYKLPSISKMATDEEKAAALTPDLDITFNWFAPSGTGANFLVKSWNPQFEGEISIGLALTLATRGDECQTFDENGNLVTISTLGGTQVGINNSEKNCPPYNNIQEHAQWSFKTQYPYKAKMIIQGSPCEIPMTGKIRVNALMHTQKHHSSGIYYILGINDIMNSSGYFTELDLFKVTPTYNPEVKEMNENTNNVGFNAGDLPVVYKDLNVYNDLGIVSFNANDYNVNDLNYNGALASQTTANKQFEQRLKTLYNTYGFNIYSYLHEYELQYLRDMGWVNYLHFIQKNASDVPNSTNYESERNDYFKYVVNFNSADSYTDRTDIHVSSSGRSHGGSGGDF